jgi:hypothetical protein
MAIQTPTCLAKWRPKTTTEPAYPVTTAGHTGLRQDNYVGAGLNHKPRS